MSVQYEVEDGNVSLVLKVDRPIADSKRTWQSDEISAREFMGSVLERITPMDYHSTGIIKMLESIRKSPDVLMGDERIHINHVQHHFYRGSESELQKVLDYCSEHSIDAYEEIDTGLLNYFE